MFSLLFSPITIGSMTLKNRLVTTAMESCYCDDQGMVTQRYIDYVSARIKVIIETPPQFTLVL